MESAAAVPSTPTTDVGLVAQKRGLRTGSKESFADKEERAAAIASLDGWGEVSVELLSIRCMHRTRPWENWRGVMTLLSC